VAAAVVLLALANLRIGHAPVPLDKADRVSGSDWGIRDVRGFQALSLIQVIDSSTRTGFLTFLPFLLIAKGSTVRAVGFALMLVFAGGAAGKFACGVLAERLGVIRTVIVTETATGAGILLLLALPLVPALALLPALGIALNGTSSVLYGTVADLVESDRKARSYAVFYTLGIGASALSPSVYGVVSDWGGVPLALTIVGTMVFVTVPLTLALRRPLAAAAV
jgi:predicted MFS family arabinose efflux permease